MTKAMVLRRSTLVVAVKDHIWTTELGAYTYKYLVKYRKSLGEGVIRKIRFTPRPSEFKKKKRKSAEYEPETVKLPKKDEKKIRELLSEIEDEKARGIMEKFLVEKFRYERWMKKRGATPCEKCGILVEKGRTFCFFCQLELEEKSREKAAQVIRDKPWITFKEASKKIIPLSADAFAGERQRVMNALYREIVDGIDAKDPEMKPELKGRIITYAMMKTGRKPAELKDDVLVKEIPGFMYGYYKC